VSRVGIDLGGTKIEGILLEDDGSIAFRRRVATPAGDYEATLDAVADLLLEHPGSECVLLCGHQPDMSGLVAELTGGMAEFRKGTLAVIEADALRSRGGYLKALYPPSTLRSIGV